MNEARFAAARSGDLDALQAADPALASAHEDGVSAVLVALVIPRTSCSSRLASSFACGR